jgi:hypothetical protein
MTDNDGVSLTSIEHPLNPAEVAVVADAIWNAMYYHGSETACSPALARYAAEAAIRACMAWQDAHPQPDINPAALETVAIKIPTVDIVFDGPPGPEAGRFVEVENSKGHSINFGEWLQRPDGYWVLRIPARSSYSGGILNNAK